MPEEKVTKLVNAKQLVALLRDASNKKTKVAEINGEIGERIKNAAENGNLHKGLFGLMLKLSRMDELKRNDFLDQFPEYVRMCREAGLFGQEHVGDLLSDKEPTQEELDAEAAAANAEAIEKGITPIPDAEFDDSTSSRPSRRRAAVDGDAPGGYKVH